MSEKNVDARLIGIISKPHGVSGEVMVRLFTDYPKTFKRGDTLFLNENCSLKLSIENVKYKKVKNFDLVIFKFIDINDRDDAQNLKNRFLYRNVKDSPKLKTDEYWVDDIIGCKVHDNEKSFIGRIIDIIKCTSNDNLVIKKENKNIIIKGIKEDIFLLPFIDDYIENVDLKNKKIILKKIPEYI